MEITFKKNSLTQSKINGIFSQNTAFPCDKCGECCRNIGNISQLKDFDDGTGRCRYLQGNTCSIYENRPDICNVEKMYAKCFATHMSRDEFIELNRQSCQQLKAKQQHRCHP